MRKRIIVFEEISTFHRMILTCYIRLGIQIFYLRCGKHVANSEWFEAFKAQGNIQKISLDFFTFGPACHDVAFNNIEKFFKSFKNCRIVKNIRNLYISEHVDLAFKKVLHIRLARFYYIEKLYARIKKMFPEAFIFLVPSGGSASIPTDGCEIYDYRKFRRIATECKAELNGIDEATFPAWAAVGSYIRVFRRKIIATARILGMPLVLIYKWTAALTKKESISKYYPFVIMIISPQRQFANNIQKVDFLIDGKFIRKEDTIFLSYRRLKEPYKTYLKGHGLSYIDNPDMFISLNEIKGVIGPCFQLFIALFYEETFILDIAVRLIYYYARWTSFTRSTRIGKLVSYCDVEPQSIARNIILEKGRSRTYYYMDSANLGCYCFDDEAIRMGRHNHFGFLRYHTFISWSDTASRYFRSSGCVFDEYKEVGCLWAEHVKEIDAGKIGSTLFQRLRERGFRSGMKIVSIFDTSFDDGFITTYQDALEFLRDAKRLSEDIEEIFIILKEKNPRDRHQRVSDRANELLMLYRELEKKNSFYLPGHGENTSEIIALSDLTISFPFTSTTVEAFSARKKALWYDATNKFANTIYSGIPGLVCHSYAELSKRISELFKIDEEDYNAYLDKYIKPNVANYLDGKAISRFRLLLSESTYS